MGENFGKRGVRPMLGTALLASTMLAGVPALAQQQQQTVTLETVVVTAEKRTEDLQKVPMSVQALGGDELKALHATDFNDFARYLPSVEYTVGGAGAGNGAPGFDNISMRGVNSGNDGNHSGPLPTVGVYLDEMPITTTGGTLDVPTYDINRVEALSGPQGTLYGASSEAGTIRIITNKPDASGFAASYDAQTNSVGHGGIGFGLDGMVNAPITDQMAIRIVGWEEHDAGFIDNVAGTRTYPTAGITINNDAIAKNDFNTVDKLGARAALGIDLNENWTITPSIMAQQEHSRGSFGYDPSVGYLEVQHYYPEYSKDSWYQAALTIQGKIADLDLTYAGGYMSRHIRGESDYTDYTFWYDKLAGYYFTDASGNPVDSSQYIMESDHFTKLSNELRISSPSNGPVRWVAGLFQEQQSHYILQDYKVNALTSDLWVTGWPDTIWLTDQRRIDNDYAAFGEISYDVLPDLTVTGGLRLFKADNYLKGFFGFNANFSNTGEHACFEPAIVDNGPCTNLNNSVRASGETHRLNVTWNVDADRMLYATYSTGFRPGGDNRNGTLPPYSPDTLTNYEIGWKTDWAEHRVRFNGAIYLEDWKDFQFAFLGLNSLTQITNAGQAQIKGIESNVQWLVNDDFMVTGSGAYNDAKLTKVYCGDLLPNGQADLTCPNEAFPYPPEAPEGTPLPVTPRYKVNLTGRYDFEVAGFKPYFQGALVYQTSSWADLRIMAPRPTDGVDVPVRGAIGKIPAYASVDLSLGLDRDSWHAEVSLQNALNEHGQLSRYALCTTQICGNEPYIIPLRPQTIEISFGQKF
jgi:outer membrane receptor protein involved in Fe transport